MTWSIRAKLTACYSGLVMIVLIIGTLVVDIRQQRVMRRHLDGELTRLMSTLQGVMRTEFGKGLDLQASAAEARTDVLAPGRTLLLIGPDGRLLARWGLPIDPAWRPTLSAAAPVTTNDGAIGMRVHAARVQAGDRQYVAAVMAPVAELDDARAALRRTLGLGALVALAVAAIGGWLVGWWMLRPIDALATQAVAMTSPTSDLDQLRAPCASDEVGRLASAFNGLLERVVQALHGQQQVMADEARLLQIQVPTVAGRSRSVARRAVDARAVDARLAPRAVAELEGDQMDRSPRLADAVILLSRAEASPDSLLLTPVPIDDVVAGAARAVHELIRPRGMAVTTAGHTGFVLAGDRRLLDQMMRHLLDHAARHAGRGSTVSATVRLTSSTLTIRVTHRNGMRVVAAEDGRRPSPRAGQMSADEALMMPLARWIAEAHGGSLFVDPVTPGDSTFAFTLADSRRPTAT